MKKRLLFIVALATIVLSATAQQLQVSKDLCAPQKQGRLLAPAFAEDNNGYIWGYYNGDLSDATGLGFNAPDADYDAAIFVPGDKELKGGKITTVRIPVASLKMSNLRVWVRTSLAGDNVAMKEYNGELKSYEYVEVVLDEAIDIPQTGIYVGYSFSIANGSSSEDLYPILTSGSDVRNGLWLINNRQWTDLYGNGFGVSCMNVRVTGINVDANGVRFKPITSAATLAGQDSPVTAEITSDFSTGIDNIDYSIIYADGSKKSYHKDVKLPSGFSVSYKGEFTVLSPQDPSDFTARITVDKVNGQENIVKDTVTLKAKNLIRKVAHRTVVEEFTGTGCGWCPRGWVGMEKLKKNNPDNFIGIAVHQYNSSDPMYVANYYRFASGAPQCTVDRTELMDPYYGTGYDIQNDFDRLNGMLAEADISVNAEWTDANEEQVSINASIEYLANGGKYSAVFVLTADSLSGTTNAWKQGNYYSKNGERDALPEDLQFFWDAPSSVALVFNDVMINSTYNNSGTNKLGTFSEPAAVGKTQEVAYKLALPTKAALHDAIDKKLVFAVALLINTSTKHIVNAARVQLTPFVETAIQTIENGSSTVTETERYTLDGQRIFAPQKGINIVKMSNGEVRKTIVR